VTRWPVVPTIVPVYVRPVDVFDEIVKLIGTLAWPSVVFAAVVLFRKPLRKLIKRTNHAEIAGTKFDFDKELSKAGRLSKKLPDDEPSNLELEAEPVAADPPPESITPAISLNPSLKDLLALAEVQPPRAVDAAWSVVQRVLTVYGGARAAYPVTLAISNLYGRGLIDRQSATLADSLHALWASIVSGQDQAPPEAAIEYVHAAWRLASALKDALNKAAQRNQ
jgi:hypothetical protein